MSEKYWVFQNNQVVGPFGIDDLVIRPGFSGEALVCSEGRQGTDAGDWQKASMVAPIAEALSRPSSPTASVAAPRPASHSEVANDSILVKELSLLGAVHEKIGALSQNVLQMQEMLNGHAKELPALRAGIDEVALRVKTFEGAGSSDNSLNEKIEKLSGEAQARAAALEETSRSQRRSIEELIQKIDFLSQGKETVAALEGKLSGLASRLDELSTKIGGESQSIAASSALEDVKAMVGGLKEEIEKIKLHQEQLQVAPPPPMGQPEVLVAPSPTPSFSPEPPPAAIPQESPFNFSSSPFAPPDPAPVGGQSSEGSAFIPKSDPALSAGASPDFILPAGGLPASDPFSPQAAFDAPAPQILPAEGLAGSFEPTAMGVEGFPQAEPVALSAGTESASVPKAPPQKSKKGAFLVIIVIAGISLSALAYVLGLIPGLGVAKPEPVSPPHLSPPPAPALPVPAQPVSSLPQDQEETFKNSAIHLVQNWPVGKEGKTVAEILGAPVASAGGLSPWMAEKIKDNLYQVNFYAASSGTGSGKSYEFQADLALQKVVGQNQAAVALLAGESLVPVAKKIPKKRVKFLRKPLRLKKKRIVKKRKIAKKVLAKKPKDVSGDIMPGIPHPQSAVQATSPEASAGPLPGSTTLNSQPTSAAPPAPKPAAQPSEDQALDQLLKP